MLNSFNRSEANGRLPASSTYPPNLADEETETLTSLRPPPPQGFLTRLFVRRWLVLLFAVIIFTLSAFFRLPWQAEALSLIAFAIGTAVIPRSGLDFFSRPVILQSPLRQDPNEIAKTLIDVLPEPAVLLSGEGEVLAFNSRAREIFVGLRRGLHISSATRNPEILNAVMDCSSQNPLRTATFSDRVPVERHMAATISYMVTGPANTSSILLFLRDLTEQRRVDQLRSDFIANASHEIKTPLASLLGFIETLQGAARHDEAARERFLSIMAHQAERMARLIDNLMSLSRVEMRAHLKPQGTVLISDVVLHACDALEPMASEASIKVTAHSELAGVRVLGDWDELTQVFINLLHNAIKYGRPGGSVTVKLERQQNGGVPVVAISVEDDGPGIPSQHLPRLTERFYRVPGSEGLEKGGTGLGLAIVKHVLNRHRGELRITSAEGAGAKFTVLLGEHAA